MNDKSQDEQGVTMEQESGIMQTFNTFKKMLENIGTFLLENLTLTVEDSVGTVTIQLTRQHMADDLVTELTAQLDVNILYSCKSHDGSRHRIMIYSMPYPEGMCVIYIDSWQHGVVEEIYVTFFDSMDVMFCWLQKSLENIMAKRRLLDIIQLQSLTDLYRNFV